MLPRDNRATVRRRADYRPPAFLVDRIALEFDLDPDATRVTSTLTFRRNPDADPRDRDAPFALDGDGQLLPKLFLLNPRSLASDAEPDVQSEGDGDVIVTYSALKDGRQQVFLNRFRLTDESLEGSIVPEDALWISKDTITLKGLFGASTVKWSEVERPLADLLAGGEIEQQEVKNARGPATWQYRLAAEERQ